MNRVILGMARRVTEAAPLFFATCLCALGSKFRTTSAKGLDNSGNDEMYKARKRKQPSDYRPGMA